MSQEPARRGLRVPRTLGLQVFASESHAPRARRAVDATTAVVGSGLVVWLALAADDPSALEDGWEQFAAALPGWLQWLSEVAYFSASGYLLALVVGVGLVAKKRKDLLRDLLTAWILAVAAVLALGRAVDGEWPDIVLFGLSDQAETYPVLYLTILTAVHATAAPHLSRPMRHFGWWIVAGAAAAGLLANLTEVRDTVGALIGGIAIGAIIHLLFGSPAGRPSLGRVAHALTELGVDARDLAFAEHQPGAATDLVAVSANGDPLEITVYGRDSTHSRRFSQAWRRAWYRSSPERSGTGRLQQVEHAALATLLAARGETRVPEVVAVGTAGADDALLVTTSVGRPLFERAEDLDEATLVAAWDQLDALHRTDVALGRVDLDHFARGPDGRVAIRRFDLAELSADDLAMSQDRAELLTASALAVGNDRAVAAARSALGDDGLAATLPMLQPAGVSPELRNRAHRERFSIRKLRAAAAEAAGVEAPELEKLHRVSVGQLLMAGITTFAIYAVIGALADIGWDTIVDALSDATWALVLVALVLAQLTNVGGAMTVVGASPKPLPFGIVVTEQFAIAFINVAVPASAARVAMNMRFAQRFGIGTTGSATLGALTSLSGFAVQLLLLFLLLVPGDRSIDWSEIALGGTVVKLLVLAVAIGLVCLVAVLVVPSLRAKAADRLQEPLAQARRGIAVLRSPRAALLLFAGNLASQLLFAAALGLCVRSVGGTVGFAELVFINTVVSLFAGLAPVPGGIGVTEAGLIAGLTATGVPEGTAVAAVIIYRMCTYYLPPLWGWFAMKWLTENDYL